MEGNLSAGNMIPGGSYGGIDLQGSTRVHHHNHQNPHPHTLQHHHSLARQGSVAHQTIHEAFPLTMGHKQDSDQGINKGDRGKNLTSDEDEPSFNEDGHNDSGKGKKGSPWQRMKWTDAMVRLLITAVSYIGEDANPECSGGGRRKFAMLQKKGKWKSVSKVMAERGCYVSPQQCEDKFNDLNKRYKRLNDVLGRGTSCQVVENPSLLDTMDHLSEKTKDDVRKILSSKHLFYEEMCSYHNGNRLHLPADPALQRSLQLALRDRDEHEGNDARRHMNDELDEDDQDVETDDHDEFEENHAYGVPGGSSKRLRMSQGHEDVCFENPSHPQNPFSDMNQVLPEGSTAAWMQKQWMRSRSLQLEEQKLQVQVQMFELEKQRFKWQRFSRKKDRELDKLRMENERMKLENERMSLELKRKELGAGFT